MTNPPSPNAPPDRLDETAPYRLLLLRHAKSSWQDEALEDHERPLADRGIRAATAMGRYLARHYAPIDLALCSSAVRCQGTFALINEAQSEPIPKVDEPRAYLCGAAGLLDLLRDAPTVTASNRPVRTLLLIAHNPDLQELSQHLALPVADRDKALLEDIRMKFPTGALAAFAVGTGGWRSLSTATVRLLDFVKPRDLTS